MRPLIACLLILAIPMILGLILTSPAIDKPNTSGTFHMKYGGAVCGEYFETSCGITLRKCDDGKEYHCMHDVSIELDK